MSTRFSIVHEFDCDASTYWEIFWDEAFNVEQYARMKCGRTMLKQEVQGELRLRDQEIAPDRSLPAPLDKLVPQGALRYVERGRFQQPKGPMQIDIEVPRLGDRFSLKSQYTVTEPTPGRCRREYSGECSLKMLLIGGIAEQVIVSNMKDTYETAAVVHREWIAKRKT
jgi:hypothetical protein